MKKRIGKIFGVVMVLVLLACMIYFRPREEKYSVSYMDVFDTVTQFTGYAKDKEAFSKKMEPLHQQLVKFHQLFDIYHNYPGVNNIKTVNDAAGKAPVKVDKELFALLKLGKKMYETTDGKTNIAMGSVLKLWHDSRTKGIENVNDAALPEEQALKKAAHHMDISNLVLDEKKQTAYIKDKQMRLDVGSIGKGYAVELLGKSAKDMGIDSLLISVGGNILTIGKKADGGLWKIGIQNPENEEEYLCYVEAEGHCVVTSGDYQRYYVVDGKRYCHIIDPDTLLPPESFRSVSVVCKKSGMADALSTALFCMRYEDGKRLVEQIPDVEAMWVCTDGSIKETKGFATMREKE